MCFLINGDSMERDRVELESKAESPLQYQSGELGAGHRCVKERAYRESSGSRSWSNLELGRLLGAALQSFVSHANTHDRYSCDKKSCERRDDK